MNNQSLNAVFGMHVHKTENALYLLKKYFINKCRRVNLGRNPNDCSTDDIRVLCLLLTDS
jgi:hypothetical protein